MLESGPRPDLPTQEDLVELSEWRPERGVITVCLAADPGDRGVALTKLRNGLADLERTGPVGKEGHACFRASADRILTRFGEVRPSRGELGVVEVGEAPGRELWWSTQAAPSSTAISFGQRPLLAPLLDLAQAGRPRRAVLLSGERVRLLGWKPGHVELEEEWELSLFLDSWRERKARRATDPARAQAVGSSGHDRFDERMAYSRRHFLTDCGRQVAALQTGQSRGDRGVLAFGSEPNFQAFREGFDAGTEPVHAGGADLISVPISDLERTVAEAVAANDAACQLALVERALDQAAAGGRGTSGLAATREALGRGQVEHLLLDRTLPPAQSDPLIHAALASGAQVTFTSGPASDLLAPAEGTAALLRFGSGER